MTKAIKKILLATCLGTLAIATYAQTAPDFSGTYQCSGYDPYNKANFNETITFTKTGDTYSVQLAESGSAGIPYMLGTALVNKNAISFVVWDQKKPHIFGAGLYKIKSDGSLDGVWSTKATNQVGTETCVKS